MVEFNLTYLGLCGENTGAGSLEDMLLSAHQMRRYRLTGMAWHDEEQLFSGRYATLEDYERVIKCSQKTTRLQGAWIERGGLCRRA